MKLLNLLWSFWYETKYKYGEEERQTCYICFTAIADKKFLHIKNEQNEISSHPENICSRCFKNISEHDQNCAICRGRIHGHQDKFQKHECSACHKNNATMFLK